MTKKLFILCVALVWTATLMAQNIAVVSPSGSTIMCKTLSQAVDTAAVGSVIYLPGGTFTSDNIRISKKLSIFGIGHKLNAENPDGITTIGGSLYFDQGSDGSALMGFYLTGYVYIGYDDNEVDDIFVRHCNISQVNVKSSICLGTTINQNYIRDGAKFGGAAASFTNNIALSVHNMRGGQITNNIITGTTYYTTASWWSIASCSECSISNNIIIDSKYDISSVYSQTIQSVGSNYAFGNMTITEWGDSCINVGTVDWSNVFVNYDGGNHINSNFHFKGEYAQYEGKVGIYAGTGFSNKQLAPVPYIVAKHVDEQTNAQGKLNIKVRVKASGDDE